jgi:hypothetical protein
MSELFKIFNQEIQQHATDTIRTGETEDLVFVAALAL